MAASSGRRGRPWRRVRAQVQAWPATGLLKLTEAGMTMTTITHGAHILSITGGIRALPPVDGWAAFEPNGEARMGCSCGVTVGGPIDQVKTLAHHHMRDTTPEAEWPDWLR